MLLVVTGGGTGGHVFPALEVARFAREQGARVVYFGSLRGLEGRASAQAGLEFRGFNTQPVYSLKTPKGMAALARFIAARRKVRKALQALKPDVVLSTGGYAGGPVAAEARSLGIPYVLQEANSAPGRANRYFARKAFAVATTFRTAAAHFPGAKVERTGLPIRKELRDMAASSVKAKRQILIVGGSRGSLFLNTVSPKTAALNNYTGSWLHVTGPDHFDTVLKAAKGLENYEVRPFLEAEEMAQAYLESSLVIARSGGSCAEFALFGLPSVLIPLPTSADDHQTLNAQEFVEMKAATMIPQRDCTPQALAKAIGGWLDDEPRRATAKKALKDFDVPDATERIWNLIQEAVS